MRQSFTVRKVSGGVGVERTFPLHSPAVAKIDLARKGKVRRAKLFYLRGKRGKSAKVGEDKGLINILLTFTKEVEDVIALHPAVSDVAVIGLPDTEWGEAVTAFVVLKPGMMVSEGDLVDHCRKFLAGYKKPRAVRFVAGLPRSHYGKIVRAQLLAGA